MAAALVLAALWTLVPRPVSAAPPDLGGLGYAQRPGSTLPLAARLAESDGRPTTLGAMIGQAPTLLVLGYYTCPSLCGVIRDDLFAALSASGLATPRDYHLVFLSIDPAERPRDAARALAADLSRAPTPGAALGWHFATADVSAIGSVSRAVGYHSRYDVSLKQFLHPAGVVVLTPAGRVSSYLLGVGYQPAALRAALGTAREDEIGARASPVLLLCFHYDPATGRYSLAIVKLLRIMGGVTMLTILGLLALLYRRRPSPGPEPGDQRGA
ncbi:SCO family protein [Lichenicoccus sp.]|uniref:SCO family protein n=1 Tax=Lichenicoccus sp. TaxID=2781899 RepID=UPI003D104138